MNQDFFNPRSTAFWRALLGIVSLVVGIGLGALILTM
ncbi:hypothetical protein KR100_05940 [Synechococcus sp. KORDI-100]|nr:hypothetical protein KR100_05940 [Synechococcus sp. KORDI-100]